MEKIKRHRRTKAEMQALQSTNLVVPESSDSFTERHKKVEHRGRPKAAPEISELPSKFERVYEDKKTGIKSVWKYDSKKLKSGPYEVETIYPKDYDDTLPDDDSLPLTKRTWLNPANGKYVGYGRAVQLGLFVPEKGDGKRGRPKKA